MTSKTIVRTEDVDFHVAELETGNVYLKVLGAESDWTLFAVVLSKAEARELISAISAAIEEEE